MMMWSMERENEHYSRQMKTIEEVKKPVEVRKRGGKFIINRKNMTGNLFQKMLENLEAVLNSNYHQLKKILK